MDQEEEWTVHIQINATSDLGVVVWTDSIDEARTVARNACDRCREGAPAAFLAHDEAAVVLTNISSISCCIFRTNAREDDAQETHHYDKENGYIVLSDLTDTPHDTMLQ